MAAPDLPRDEHLRTALRHAPDRELGPPAAVSARILAAARDAVREPWPRRWAARAIALLDRLRQPAAGAAFASLVLATVIGLMWRDGPPPEAERDAALARNGAPAKAAAPAAPVETAPVASQAPAVAPPPAAQVAEAARPAERLRERAAAPLAKAAPARAPAAAATEPAVVAAAPAAPTARAEVAADAVTAQAAPPPPMAGLSSRAAGEARTRRVVADPLAPALAALDASRDATTADAALERADGTLSPRADPLRLWLAELQRTARGRWAAAEAPAGPATPVPGRDGRPVGRVLLGDEAVWWQGADAAWWRAPLAADELQRLRTGLAAGSAPR